MEAMTENHEIEIEYRKYSSTTAERLTLRPYAVKENAKRWYIIAYCVERQGLRVYGLDRVTSLRSTGKSFTIPKDFDVEEVFATSFGIYLPEGRGQRVLFKTSQKEARYLRDLPIHSSQWVESEDAESVTFGIFVCTKDSSGKYYNDLIMELCRYGSRIEVLSPEDVRTAVADELKKAAAMY
jgi:predicted DNA-binding transcriptional regulator YafY